MISESTSFLSKINSTYLLIVSSLLITLLLSFIEEGNYNFQWIYDFGSWIAFFLYSIVFFFFQFLVFHIVLKKYQNAGKILLSILIGTSIGLLFMLGIIFN